MLSPLSRADGGRWRPLAAPETLFQLCTNAGHDACNWLVPADGRTSFCRACRHNRTIPDLAPPDHLLRWQRLEAAKHRLIYGLLRLGLPLVSNKFDDPKTGLAFDFLADPAASSDAASQVMTGHAAGLITINVAEADDAERERIRSAMGEPYRTLLGHFRHEVGHYYRGSVLFGTASGWSGSGRYSATSARTTAPASRCITTRVRPRTGGSGSSAAMPAHTHGRISPRLGRTTCTSSTTLETAAAFGLRVRPGPGAIPRWPRTSTSILTVKATSTP